MPHRRELEYIDKHIKVVFGSTNLLGSTVQEDGCSWIKCVWLN